MNLHGRHLAWTLTVFFALSGALSAGANAATLDLSGPVGARVFVDGEERGVLPLTAPVEVEKGDRVLELRLAGFEPLVQTVKVVADDSDMILQLEMLRLQRWKAMTYSALLAGLGQHYESRSRRGWTMMGLQLVAATVAGIGEAQFQSSRDDYEILDRKYFEAVSPSEIVSLREQRDAAYDDMDSAERIRNIALASVVAVGVWSVVDAYLGFDDLYVDVARRSSSTRAAAGEDAFARVELGWRVGF